MSPIVPIPPFYNEDESLNNKELGRYLKYLSSEGVETIMTTAGTSQYNLLSNAEIINFNWRCYDYFDKQLISGISPAPLTETKRLLRCIKGSVKNDDIALILYPDRLYDEQTIIDFFFEVADDSPCPIWIHAQPLRSGYGLKWVDYPLDVIQKLSEHPNITGLKEESLHYETAYQVSRLANDNFTICVAGGSGRRFSLCINAGANTYLSGLGSVFPKLENALYECIYNGEQIFSSKPSDHPDMMLKLEDKFFDVMSKYGWHISLRYAIKALGFEIGNKKPFPELRKADYLEIEDMILEMKESYGN